MNQLFQWIGTFASIISVPLAIYFYFKTMDGKYEKVRKELLALFSNYIGAGNKLTHFYLSSVINAKLREKNIKAVHITEESIVEDLIVEIISNPLLSNDAKNGILSDLETLVNSIQVPNGKLAGKSEALDQSETDVISERRKQLAEALRKGEATTSKGKREIQYEKISSIVIAWMSIIATILSFLISTEQVTEIFSIIDLTNTVTQIFIGAIASILASLIVVIIQRITKRK